MDEASGHEKTLNEALDRSAESHERAEAQKTTWSNPSSDSK
jgi:hypothetical protein